MAHQPTIRMMYITITSTAICSVLNIVQIICDRQIIIDIILLKKCALSWYVTARISIKASHLIYLFQLKPIFA